VTALRGRVHDRIADVPRAAWNALLTPDDTPFVDWRFLEALEASGSAVSEAGWWPRHLTLWRGDRLVAAAPAYVKVDSAGDFSRDWGWYHMARQAGVPYYPKLVVGVPFSPVPGRRLLVDESDDFDTAVRLLMALALEQARAEEVRSVNVLFCGARESSALQTAGFHARTLFQFHWHNRGYESYEAWLATFNAKRRHQLRRERGEAARQGVCVRTVRGAELAAEPARWADEFHRLYLTTCDKYVWGRPYLTAGFYRRLFEVMPEHVEVVAAWREGRVVAGALNLSSASRLFGRYWGCHESHRFLHFHVCLYHSVEDCIVRGLSAFEGGMGGEHKLARGFEPVLVHSAHRFLEPALDAAIAQVCALETESRTAELARWQQESSSP
jgi:uncharacterized protein